MGDQFHWEAEEEEFEEVDPSQAILLPNKRPWLRRHLRRLLLALALVLVALVSVVRVRQTQVERQLEDAIRTTLELETQAFRRGDGDLFFAPMSDDPAWRAAQLLPANQAVYEAGMKVSDAVQLEEDVWATVSWQEAGERRQRVAFFRWRNGQLLHVPTLTSFWGEQQRLETTWGEILYFEADAPYVTAVAEMVSAQVTAYCAVGCAGRLPLQLVLRDDFRETAAPQTLHLPSPRLVALDGDGQPAPLFWEELQTRLQAFLTPATIRFAILPVQTHSGQLLRYYEMAAARFMVAHPQITIELEILDELPADVSDLVVYDGAAMPLTADMVAAGLVRDLTEFANTDPDFDPTDFYEQIWQGTVWMERTWFVPHAATMPVLFYDSAAYREAGLPEPPLRWTWEEMRRDVANIVSVQPDSSQLVWGFLNIGLESLYSYAYNWNARCAPATTAFCQNELKDENVAAALTWYAQMAGQMPNLVGNNPDLPAAMPAFEQADEIIANEQFLLQNFQATRRKAAIWVDLPINYELQVQLASLGVVSFPGSERFDGITPLWVRGGFITQNSERPHAVWEWLTWLSYERPQQRMVPARPSVAQDFGYWSTLPRPLGNSMRTAFPFAQPVTLADQTRLTWPQVQAVVDGEATPAEAARNHPDVVWFGR